jgi:hypothetical protein
VSPMPAGVRGSVIREEAAWPCDCVLRMPVPESTCLLLLQMSLTYLFIEKCGQGTVSDRINCQHVVLIVNEIALCGNELCGKRLAG